MDVKVSQVAKDLKRLRKKSGIPLRVMAKTLDFMTAGSYQHYEDRFKKDSLPYELAIRVSKALQEHGLTAEELRPLFRGYNVDGSWSDGYCQGQDEMRRRATEIALEIGSVEAANVIRNLRVTTIPHNANIQGGNR